MYRNFIYPEIIKELLLIAEKHLKGKSSIHDFQKAVQIAEMSIVAVEEKIIRNYLTDIEGKLELILYTTSESERYYNSKKIAVNLIDWLEKWKNDHFKN